MVEDIDGRILGKFAKVRTAFKKSIGLTKSGQVYVWGSGPLGLGSAQRLEKPARLKLSGMPIRPQKLLASGSSFLLFIPCKFLSLNPQITFSRGGTLCNIVGGLTRLRHC